MLQEIEKMRLTIGSAAQCASIILALLLSSSADCFAQLIQNSDSRASVSLDGQWRVIIDPYENGFYNHRFEEKDDGYFKNAKVQAPSDLIEYDFSTSQPLNVPGDWNSQDERLFFYEGSAWYQKDFAVQRRADKRYVLHFGAANYTAVVYVNGVKIGSHEGGFTPFQFDVSEQILDGDNVVVVKVDNRRERDNVPTVNTDWWNYGGITRPVKLLVLDPTYISDYFIQLDRNDSDAIAGWVRLDGDTTNTAANITISIPELGIEADVTPDSKSYGTFRVKASPELWSPEDPRLYEVRLSYGGDSIQDHIGFRTIEASGEDILLNGEPVYLRGISIHEEAPTREGRAWSEDDARKTLTWAKELGCNFVRLAHYPHNEAIVRMADEMGLMVWSEIPVYWTIKFEEAYVYDKAEQQLDEMISRDKNRAAVILWSVANETPNHEARFSFLDKLVKRGRELDSTRLLTAAMDTQVRDGNVRRISDPFAESVDVIGINSYCGWYSNAPKDCASMEWASDYVKPVIVSEFGGGALLGKHGDSEERWTEEYQAAVYKHNLTMIDNMSFVRGTTPWILKDFRSPRRPLPLIQDFWNRKGLLSEDGHRKQAWYLLQEFYKQKAAAE